MVITSLTRNQVYRKVPWVRIPPPPPIKPLKTLRFQGFFIPRNAVKILSSTANAVNAVTVFVEMQLKSAIQAPHSRSIRKSPKMQNAVKMQ